jgi:hypothetical protein
MDTISSEGRDELESWDELVRVRAREPGTATNTPRCEPNRHFEDPSAPDGPVGWVTIIGSAKDADP